MSPQWEIQSSSPDAFRVGFPVPSRDLSPVFNHHGIKAGRRGYKSVITLHSHDLEFTQLIPIDPNRSAVLNIRGNLPKLIYPDNLELLALQDQERALQELERRVRRVITLAEVPSWKEFKIRHIETAFNVKCENPNAFILKLQRHLITHIPNQRQQIDRYRDGTGIVYLGEDAKKRVAYSKFEEAVARQNKQAQKVEGILRLELRWQPGRCGKNGERFLTLGDYFENQILAEDHALQELEVFRTVQSDGLCFAEAKELIQRSTLTKSKQLEMIGVLKLAAADGMATWYSELGFNARQILNTKKSFEKLGIDLALIRC